MSQGLARYLVFVTSASVLVLEILAGRLLAPYLGVSLEVFTGIIGVILAGIAVGAWFGGRLADRGEPSRLLGPLLVGGGLTSVLAPLVVDLAGPTFSPEPVEIVLITAFAFFLPAAILSAVTPVVVKIRLSSLSDTGSVVGSFSAIGTAGALAGTFITGFVLIAAFPTRPIVFSVGAILTLTGIILMGTRSIWIAGLFALLGIVMITTDGPCQYETSYHCAIVVVDPELATGRTLLLDSVRNSYVDLADPTHLEFRYLRALNDVVSTHLSQERLDALHIGGGGFTYPGYLSATRSDVSNTILEIDPSLVTIGVDHLGLQKPEEVVVGDARQTIETVPPGTVDLVVGDAFSGYSVPWHLTTVEFVSEIRDRLRPGGLYVLNIIDYASLGFVRAELATLSEVFDHVAVFAPALYLAGEQGGNFVIVGSDSPIDVPAVEALIRERGGTEMGLTGPMVDEFVAGAVPLVDDFAPVDQLLTQPFRSG